MILNSKGDPIQSNIPSPNRPTLSEVAVSSVRDRWSSYPSNGLTPEKLARILKEADQGDLHRQAELFEEMEEKDGHLTSQLQNRKNAILGLDWEVISVSKDPRDQKIAEFIIQALERIEGLEDNFFDMLDAIGKGLSPLELMWEIKDGFAYIKTMKHRHLKKFRFDEDDQLRVMTDESPYPGILLPENKFVIHRYKARSGHPSRAGVLRVCTWMYLFKNYSVKDWVAFAEIFGMPIRVGKYDPNATPEDKDALKMAVTMLGSDAAGIISKSTEIEFIEAASKSQGSIHEILASFCNSEMSKAILGQTLTSDSGKNGSRSLGTVHDGVRQDIKEADCKALAETLRRYIIKPLIRFNFGEAAKLPWIKFHYEPSEDVKQNAEVYDTLISKIGLPVSQEHVYEKFGIPQPKEGERLIASPTSMASYNSNRWIPLKEERPRGDPQKIVDEFVDEQVHPGVKAIESITDPLEQMIANATSLEELRDQLLETYKDMDTRELESLLARALYSADLYARWTVKNNV